MTDNETSTIGKYFKIVEETYGTCYLKVQAIADEKCTIGLEVRNYGGKDSSSDALAKWSVYHTYKLNTTIETGVEISKEEYGEAFKSAFRLLGGEAFE